MQATVVPSVAGATIDAKLIAAMRADDVSALAALFDRFGADVFGLCLHLTADRLAAESLLLEVFVEVWGRRDRLCCPATGMRRFLLGLTHIRAHHKRKT